MSDFFPGFEQRHIETSGGKINLVTGGSGPPLLLLQESHIKSAGQRATESVMPPIGIGPPAASRSASDRLSRHGPFKNTGHQLFPKRLAGKEVSLPRMPAGKWRGSQKEGRLGAWCRAEASTFAFASRECCGTARLPRCRPQRLPLLGPGGASPP